MMQHPSERGRNMDKEAMFERYSQEKQEKVFMDLFRKIEDKSYLYGMALIVYEREERERKEGKRKGKIINLH